MAKKSKIAKTTVEIRCQPMFGILGGIYATSYYTRKENHERMQPDWCKLNR